MKKRVLSMFMALALCLTLLGTTALAEGAEGGAAQIGEKTYSTLPAAVDAAKDGDTIKLLADYGVDGGSLPTIAVTKRVTLDLNGHGIEHVEVGQTDEETEEVLATGNLTVEDTSAEKTGKVTEMIELLAGELTINGGTIGNDRDGVRIENGNLTVNGGAIGYLYGSNSGTVTITGGTVKNARFGEGFNITVTGGSGHTGLWDVSEGTWNISGGAFEGVTFLTGSSAENLHITGGTFGKITRKILRDSIEALAPISGLLADGYAFYQKTDSEEYDQCVKLTDAIAYLENVQVKPHTHNSTGNDNVCTECGKEFAASVTAQGSVSYYDTIDSAFTAAHEGDTVTLLADITNRGGRGIFVSGGPYTLDLNGHRIEAGIDLMVGDMDGSGALLRGELTVKDSSTDSAGYVQYLKLWNGNLTVESGNFHQIIETGPDSVGTITITGGTADEVKHTSAGVTFRLSGGTFKYVENIVSGRPGDLLADNRAFFNRNNNGNFVNGYDDRYQAVSDVVVKEHMHHIVNGSCECGFTCAHDWSEKNGVCPICSYHCPHNAGATEAGGVWACDVCGQTVTAMVTAPNGAITYYADGRLDNGNPKSGLYFAMKAAESGSTVTALGGEYLGGYVTGGKTLTLDMSNGKTIDGILYVGDRDTGNKLIVRGGVEISYVIVDPGNNLDLTGWTGRIGSLTVLNGGKAKLNGGTFEKLTVRGAAAGSLLASGYALQYVDSGAYVECSTTDTIENVKVVPCPHPDAKDGKCLYCGQTGILARVGDTTYGSVSDAVSAWKNAGGTLKLYADYGQSADGNDLDLSSATARGLAIDLNGHTFYQNCKNNITLGGGKALTITDSSGKGTGVFGPVTADRGTLTLESGHLQGLKVSSDSLVTIHLRGGKVTDILYPVPIFNLLPDGYALMSVDNPVDPAMSLFGSGVYTIKNSQTQFIDAQKKGGATFGSDTIPFMLSLKTGDPQIEKMGFEWYIVEEDGTTQKLAATTSDVTPGTNGVYTCNAANMTVDPNGWTGLEANETYTVLCVVTGKAHDGTPKWQTPMRGYELTVTPADLSQGAVVFTQVADEYGFNKGNIGDGKGTFVFTPYGGDAGSATEWSYLFEVSCNGRKLTAGSDYIVTGGSTAQWAGTYTLTIEGKGNYTGTAAHQWEIEPYTLSKVVVARVIRNYDGTTNLSDEQLIGLGRFSENIENRNSKNPILGGDSNRFTIQLGAEDFEVSNVKLGSAEAGDTTASFTIKLKPRPGQTAANFVFEDGTSEMTVKEVPVSTAKAFLSSSPEAGELNVANNHAGVYTLDLAALLPKLESPKEYGNVTYALGAVNINGGYYDAAKGNAEVKDGKLILPIQAVETSTESNIGTVTVKVTSGNIVDFNLTIKVNATNKIVPTGTPTLSAKALTYGQALSAIKLSGTMKDGDKTVPGTFAWADGTVKPEVGNGTYEAAWKFTPTDGDTYAEATGTVSITVNKAKLTGDPIYTRITAANKTLKDAALKPNTSWPTGTIQWVDKDGKELENTTEVKANTAYKWIFTPNAEFAANYTTATGELTLYSVSTGGGGGSSSSTTTKTNTVTNPDGSVTKTETKKDGTKVETTTGKDGSVSKTTTNPNGSSVTETKAADGSTGTVKTDKNGQTTAETTLSSKAIEDAKKSGEPVKAPVEVKASRDSSTAPTVKVDLPKNSGDTKVEIPVSNVKPGTVAVLVHADGTEEIVKNSLPTEDGIQLTVNGGATVKIVDNSKDFADTRNHWAKDAIDFVSARGLVSGMSGTTYAPDASTTRAQLWTILARQSGADLTGGATWYEKAQNWAKEKGISDGTNPNGTINRAQMVTMLWRAMGQSAAGSAANFTDVPADSYYAQAVAWAVENGITTGTGNGKFSPDNTCTRAQIAVFLYRNYQSK